MTDMRSALEAAKSWIERWSSHVANCRGGNECTCGRTAILFECSAALAAPGEPVAWPAEPTREMCEAMPVLPALTQDDLRFKALGWPMYAIQNRHRLIAALAVAPASPHALSAEEVARIIETHIASGYVDSRRLSREIAAAIAKGWRV